MLEISQFPTSLIKIVMHSSLRIRFPITRPYSAEVSLKKRACRRWRPSTRQLRFVNQVFILKCHHFSNCVSMDRLRSAQTHLQEIAIQRLF